MRILILLFVTFIGGCSVAQPLKTEFPESFSVEIKNTLGRTRYDAVVFIAEADLLKRHPAFNAKNFVVLRGKTEVASQYNFADFDMKGIVVVLDSMEANEKSSLTIRYSKNAASAPRGYQKRTHAELSRKTGGKFVNREYVGGAFEGVKSLRVPPEHKDHSWFLRFEGPGWESDKVGYRFYLDQRNATDVFGKKTSEIVLPGVGQDGFDSYHEMQPWGMDVLKVGKSLGLGSPAYVKDGKAIRVEKTDSVQCTITEDGDVYSSITTKYYGWQLADKKTDLTSVLGITAGSRLTRQLLVTDKSVSELCTGIIKDNAAEVLVGKGSATSFSYLATFGSQSLNKDNLGLAIFVRPADLQSISADDQSHLLNLKSSSGRFEYYFLAAWSGETNGIQTKKEFEAYLAGVAEELSNPVRVSVRSKE